MRILSVANTYSLVSIFWPAHFFSIALSIITPFQIAIVNLAKMVSMFIKNLFLRLFPTPVYIHLLQVQ